MSILWIWLGIILDINIDFGHARARSRMIRRSTPNVFQQLHFTEFLEHYTAPVSSRAHRLKSTLAVATILVTDNPHLSVGIPPQSMRTK